MKPVAVCPTRSATISSAPQQGAAVNRISSADANARFRSVVLPHLDDAYSLARWLTGSRADSEDVVQEACIAIAEIADAPERAQASVLHHILGIGATAGEPPGQ